MVNYVHLSCWSYLSKFDFEWSWFFGSIMPHHLKICSSLYGSDLCWVWSTTNVFRSKPFASRKMFCWELRWFQKISSQVHSSSTTEKRFTIEKEHVPRSPKLKRPGLGMKTWGHQLMKSAHGWKALPISRRNNEFMMVLNANPGSRAKVEQATHSALCGTWQCARSAKEHFFYVCFMLFHFISRFGLNCTPSWYQWRPSN